MVEVSVKELAALEVFNQWGKTSIEITNPTFLILNIEGPVDRFSVKIYPNGKTMFNRDYYLRCFNEMSSINMYKMLDVISKTFETECYDVTNAEMSEPQLKAL